LTAASRGIPVGVIPRRILPVAGVLVLVWLALAYCSGPPSAHEYRRTAVEAAQSALSAVRTVVLAGDAHDRLLPPTHDVVVEDAAGSVASAQQRLTAQAPPDDGTRQVRDQLLPLLVQASREIADASDAADPKPHLDRLRDLGDKLDAFVERYR
jgi:hypothetical protein